MKSWVAAVLLVLAPTISKAQGGLLNYPDPILDTDNFSNGDFESGDLSNWSGTTGWSIATDEVHGGTYSAKTTTCSASLYQRPDLKEGSYYRMSGWIKAENVSDGGIRLLINSKTSPYCLYGCGSTDSEDGTFDWTYFEVAAVQITADVSGFGYVNCYQTPILGTIWVDDVEFHEELPQPLVAKLIKPSYRGYLWSDMDQEAVFEITNNDGGTVESVITYVSDPGNPVTDTHGTNPGTVTLPLTGDATVAFRIQGEATPDYPQYKIVTQAASARLNWNLSWTDDNRFRINDTPTFLLGVYDSGLGYSSVESAYNTAWDDYRRLDEIDSDLNMYLNYWWGNSPTAEQIQVMMDALEDRGIWYFQTSNCFAENMGAAETFPCINDETYLTDLSDHPQFFGCYIADECKNYLADDVFEKVVISREWAPKGADLVVNNNPGGLTLWYDVGDVIAADSYVIHGADPDPPFNEVARDAAIARAGVSDSRPFMMVLQFWKHYGDGRFPTTAELRNMSYMAITEGAQGLFYWSIGNGTGALAVQCGTSTTWCDPEPELYQRLKDVVAELRDMESVILGADDDLRLVATNNSNIGTLAKSAGYIFAYNDTNTEQDITFTWDQTISAVVAMNEGSPHRSITPSSTQFTDTFDSYEAHVYQITDGGAPPDPELDILGKLRGQVSATSVRLVFGDSDLKATVSCAAALKDSGGDTLETNTLSTGFATRATGFDGLTASTQYSIVVSCTDYEDATYAFTTKAALTGTATYSIALEPNAILTTAAKAKVDYRIPGAGTSSVTDESCASGCTVELTLNRGVLYEIRHHWLDSSDNTLATSDWRNAVVE